MREYSLASIQTEGWVEEVLRQSPQFSEAADALGRMTFALALLAGVELTAIELDPRRRKAARVSFRIPSGETNKSADDTVSLSASDFHGRLVKAVLSSYPATMPAPSAELEAEEVTALIGAPFVMLAPMVGLELLQLIVDAGAVSVLVTGVDYPEPLTMGIAAFRGEIEQRVTEYRESEPTGELDLRLIAVAREAFAQDKFSEVIRILGSWVNPLAMLNRHPDSQQIPRQQREQIIAALELISAAYQGLGQRQNASEVLRLALQWGKEEQDSARLFLQRAKALMTDGEYGQAITPLCRAIKLGEAKPATYAMLCECFIARKKYLEAYACLRAITRLETAESDAATTLTELASVSGDLDGERTTQRRGTQREALLSALVEAAPFDVKTLDGLFG